MVRPLSSRRTTQSSFPDAAALSPELLPPHQWLAKMSDLQQEGQSSLPQAGAASAGNDKEEHMNPKKQKTDGDGHDNASLKVPQELLTRTTLFLALPSCCASQHLNNTILQVNSVYSPRIL